MNSYVTTCYMLGLRLTRELCSLMGHSHADSGTGGSGLLWSHHQPASHVSSDDAWSTTPASSGQAAVFQVPLQKFVYPSSHYQPFSSKHLGNGGWLMPVSAQGEHSNLRLFGKGIASSGSLFLCAFYIPGIVKSCALLCLHCYVQENYKNYCIQSATRQLQKFHAAVKIARCYAVEIACC